MFDSFIGIDPFGVDRLAADAGGEVVVKPEVGDLFFFMQVEEVVELLLDLGELLGVGLILLGFSFLLVAVGIRSRVFSQAAAGVLVHVLGVLDGLLFHMEVVSVVGGDLDEVHWWRISFVMLQHRFARWRCFGSSMGLLLDLGRFWIGCTRGGGLCPTCISSGGGPSQSWLLLQLPGGPWHVLLLESLDSLPKRVVDVVDSFVGGDQGGVVDVVEPPVVRGEVVNELGQQLHRLLVLAVVVSLDLIEEGGHVLLDQVRGLDIQLRLQELGRRGLLCHERF